MDKSIKSDGIGWNRLDQTFLKIDLEVFQGPFDLLLHLIKSMEVDIYDIPIAEITQQYLDYLHSMKELELDIVGDYLVMAATLIEIKSRMLLPIEPLDNEDSEYESGDPRISLVQQLLMYQQFQEVTQELQDLELSRSKLFSRPMTNLTNYQDKVPLEPGQIELISLAETMSQLLQDQLSRQPQTKSIQHEYVTVEEMMNNLLEGFDQHSKISFNQFIKNQSRFEIITSFIALLELVRNQTIHFVQKDLYQPIYMMKNNKVSDVDGSH